MFTLHSLTSERKKCELRCIVFSILIIIIMNDEPFMLNANLI